MNEYFFCIASIETKVSICLTMIICFLSLIIFLLVGKNHWHWLVRRHMHCVMISILLLAALFAGFSSHPRSVIFSWPVICVYCISLVFLGVSILQNIRHIKTTTASSLFSQFGLWLIFLSLGMGEYDRKTFYMPVLENKTEWRGYNMCDSVEALPVAIRLENIRQNRKTYARILAFTRSGEEKQGEVSVNNPFRLESWKIYYQKDITNKNVQGVQFKLVKNPWDCITCCGMCLLVLGCVLFIIKKWN